MVCTRARWLLVVLLLAAAAGPAQAQQTGAITGKVVDTGGGVLPGVTVEVRGAVLPAVRSTTTEANGQYHLPALPPGEYTLTAGLYDSKSRTMLKVDGGAPGQETVSLGPIQVRP